MEKVKPNPVGDNVAANVRRLRKEMGLSLAELSGRLLGRELSLKTLSKIENGDRSVDVDDLAVLATALRSTVTELMAPPEPAEAKVVALVDTWRSLIDEQADIRAEFERGREAIQHAQAAIREAVAEDPDASAALEDRVRSMSRDKKHYEAQMRMILEDHDGKR